MRLNGKNFTIFSTDTILSISSRIAAKYDSLPEWLMFTPPLADPKELKDTTVVDFLAKIRGSDTLDLPTPPFPTNVTSEEVCEVFIATNEVLNSAPYNRLPPLFSTFTGKLHKDPETIWRNRDAIIGQLAKKIRKNKADSEELSKKAEQIESIPSIFYTDLEIDRVQFTVDFGDYGGDLLELFNTIIPDKYVPYVACTAGPRTVYKVFHSFQINPEWMSLKLNNVILLKVNSEKIIREIVGLNKFKHYTSAALAITDEGKLICTMDAAVAGDKRVCKQQFLDRVVSVLSPELNPPTISQDNLILSHFAFPMQCFDPVIFADAVMLNEILNKFVAIDEFARASRITPNSAYIKRIDETGSSSLILKQTSHPGEFGLKFMGEWYILCRMRTRDKTEATALQLLLSRIFTIYNEVHDDLAKEYKMALGRMYTPITCSGMATKRIRKIKGLKGLRAIEPEIFYPTYTRKCTNPPIIVSSTAEAKNSVMLFPTKGEVGRDMVPVTPRLYTCDIETHKYIGLRANDLQNKDLFPYVPCCFARDQFTRKGSAYREYFNNEMPSVKNKGGTPEIQEYTINRGGYINDLTPTQIDFQETDEFKPGQLRSLPPPIERFFQLILLDPMKKVERCSVRSTKYSAIEAILFARGVIKYKKMRLSTVNNRLGKVVEKLRNNADLFAMAVKQERYDSSIEEIKQSFMQKLLLSVDVRALELLLDCNIFIFTNDGLFIPPHLRMYAKFKPNRETFFLYENPNELVEIIGVRDTYGPSESFRMVFDPNENLTIDVFNVFRRMSLAYSDLKEIPLIKLPKLSVDAQVIDSYGKCRVMIVEGKTFIPALPLPPFAAKNAIKFPRTTVEKIQNINKCVIIERRVVKKTTREVVVKIGTIYMTILTNDKLPNSIPIANHGPKYEQLESESAVLAYKSLKRRASQLLQDTINRVLSVMTKNGDRLEEALREFAAQNGGLTEDNKRLLYACSQWIRTHAPTGPIKLVNSKDLVLTPHSYILDGEEALRNLIKTYSYDYTHISNTVRDINTPYFLEYKHEIYLAILLPSFEAANNVISTWLRTSQVNVTDAVETDVTARIYDQEKLVKEGDRAGGCKILLVDDSITALLKIKHS